MIIFANAFIIISRKSGRRETESRISVAFRGEVRESICAELIRLIIRYRRLIINITLHGDILRATKYAEFRRNSRTCYTGCLANTDDSRDSNAIRRRHGSSQPEYFAIFPATVIKNWEISSFDRVKANYGNNNTTVPCSVTNRDCTNRPLTELDGNNVPTKLFATFG